MEQSSNFDIGLGLEGSHVVVTGGAGAIGSVVVQAFLAAGCLVTAMDINDAKLASLPTHSNLQSVKVDIMDEAGLEKAFYRATGKFGLIAICVAAAGKDLSFIEHHGSMIDMPVEQFETTIRVNVTGTFLTARAWMKGLDKYARADARNLSLIIFGSEAGTYGVRSNADYATSKAALIGLGVSLATDVVSIHPRARVNVVRPGPVDTPQFRKECAEDPQMVWTEYGATTALKSAVPMEVVARTCLFLASEVRRFLLKWLSG